MAPRLADLSVGDATPSLTVPPLSRTMFVRYAGASGDFNPMHHDDTIATKVGNPSVFGHGMLTAGLMARVVKDWFGPEALRRALILASPLGLWAAAHYVGAARALVRSPRHVAAPG